MISEEDMYRIDTMPDLGWPGEHPARDRVKISFTPMDTLAVCVSNMEQSLLSCLSKD